MKRILCSLLTLLLLAAGSDLAARNNNSSKKVKNVIYMIGDGMGLTQVSMMMIENNYQPSAFNRAANIALISTYSANNRVTDSAAAGTALATGHKTNNGTLGLLPDGTPCPSIMAIAQKAGYGSGLVVTVTVEHATPGAFYAHVKDRGEDQKIAQQLVESNVDVVLGGGKTPLAADKGNGKTLIDDLKAKGYDVVYDMASLQKVDKARVVGLFADGYMPTVVGGRDKDYLSSATQKTLDLLSSDARYAKKGFIMMVEGSQIDSQCHANDAAGALGETRDFERAVKVAMDFADQHPGTLVVVTADHETGGLAATSNNADFKLSDSGINYHFGTTGHSGTLVPVYLYGAGAEQINGIMDNTDLPKKIASLMGLKME